MQIAGKKLLILRLKNIYAIINLEEGIDYV